MADVKLGIVRLGRIAGKTKYTILDEEDISLVESFAFEPRMNIDHNGNGSRIYAYAYNVKQGRLRGRRVHEMIWEKHKGPVPPGYSVIHKNKITVDNRLVNLHMVRSCDVYEASQLCKSDPLAGDRTLYYLAIQQLPPDSIDEQFPELNVVRFYDANGELMEETDDNQTFYECHFPPCANLEKEMSEFSVCGHCQKVRYCGPGCQQKDWMSHKKHCRARKRKHKSSSLSPER